jgi:hypothetical protein
VRTIPDATNKELSLLGPHGYCYFPGGNNIWVIVTDKGRFKTIVWFNYSVKPVDPRAAANDEKAQKRNQEREQNFYDECMKIIRANAATPEKAITELTDKITEKGVEARNKKIDGTNIQIMTIGYEKLPPPGKKP